MRKICKVTVNNEPFLANCGDLLLDWALMNGVELPHDCRSGICGACRVRLVDGKVFGGHEQGDDMIHACQARIVSDLEIVTEPVPEPVSLSAQVADIARLAPDVIGVDVELPKPLRYLPGQYCKRAIPGFPVAMLQPDLSAGGPPDDRLLHFHIRKLSDGAVSSALGREIRVGHRVKVTGPLGSAFLRPNHAGSIVLVASGTGFAPMWSIAVAAIMERPQRELIFVVAARKLQSLYMHARAVPPGAVPQRHDHSDRIRAAGCLARDPHRTANRSSAEFVGQRCRLHVGRAGHDRGVARIARAAGARCYTDPFVSSGEPAGQPTMARKLTGWLNTPHSNRPVAQPSRKPAIRTGTNRAAFGNVR